MLFLVDFFLGIGANQPFPSTEIIYNIGLLAFIPLLKALSLNYTFTQQKIIIGWGSMTKSKI